jgi:Heterokaryon incompatibility protein (HET)
MANSQRRQKRRFVILPAVGPDLAPLTTENGLYRCQLLEYDAPNIESRYLDLSELKGSNVATQDSYKGSAVQRDICWLCSEFSRDLQLSHFGESEAHSLAHWEPLSPTEPRIWDLHASTEAKSTSPHITVAFQHYSNFDDIASSADQGCRLCILMSAVIQAYDSAEQDLLRSSLNLQLVPTKTMKHSSIFPGFRDLILRVQTSRGSRVFWTHICNVLELSRVQGPLTNPDMAPKKREGISIEELGIGRTSARDEKPRVIRQFDEDMNRDVPQNPFDTDTILLYSHWLGFCCSEHSACSSSNSRLPTRVIDVSLTNSNQSPFLFVSHGITDKYVALSYCWGPLMPVKLTENNLKEFQTSIDLATLPKTFQDAIALTRSLKIPYLWVDALCIIQDSSEDWKHEAPRMKDIYQGSTLTISALRAENVLVGFSSPRAGFKVSLPAICDDGRRYVIREPCRDFQTALRQSRISTRGWCFQERIMSPRILHLGQEQNFWECRTAVCQENGVKYPSETSFAESYPEFSEHQHIKNWLFSQRLPRFQSQYNLWYRAVEMYTQLHLIFQNDRLAAIAGIAHRFQENGAGPYVGGLWKQDLLAGIHWVPYNERGFAHNMRPYDSDNSDICEELNRSASCQAPSWSWASVQGRIRFLLDDRLDEVILEYSAPLPPQDKLFSCGFLGIDDEGGGRVDIAASKAILRLRAYCAEVLYIPPRAGHCCGELILPGRNDSDLNMSLRGCIMDTDRNTKRFCTSILLYARDRDKNKGAGTLATFLLVDAPEGSNCFHRVGFCYTLLNPDVFEIERFSISNVKIE